MTVCNVLIFGADQVLTGPAVELRSCCFDRRKQPPDNESQQSSHVVFFSLDILNPEGGGSTDVSILVLQGKWKVISKTDQERELYPLKASKANLSLSS